MSDQFYLGNIFGYREIKRFHRIENGKLVHYSYTIKRNREGKELSRTKPVSGIRLVWSNGKPFTDKDAERLQCHASE